MASVAQMLIVMLMPFAGLSNPEEFSFTTDEETTEHILRRAQAKDRKKLDALIKRLHTDDECNQQVATCTCTYTLYLWGWGEPQIGHP